MDVTVGLRKDKEKEAISQNQPATTRLRVYTFLLLVSSLLYQLALQVTTNFWSVKEDGKACKL